MFNHDLQPLEPRRHFSAAPVLSPAYLASITTALAGPAPAPIAQPLLPAAISATSEPPGLNFIPSPNYNSRNATTVDSIVIHTTEGNYDVSLATLTNGASSNPVSSHFLIEPNGRITQLVNTANRAWHATYYNSRSIGIEMVGFAGQASTWTTANLAAVQNLCAYLIRKYPTIPTVHPTTNANDYPDQRLNLPGIVAHGQIQPWNRTDPGAYFPWTDFINAVKAKVANPTTTLTNTTATYARGSSTFAAKNFGAQPTLEVKKHSSPYYTRESFLKFDLTKILSISKAKLRLYGKLSDTANASVLMQLFGHSNTSWSESSLTWNNRPIPATGAAPIASATIAGTTAKWYDIDITNYLKAEKAAGRNTVTLILRNPSASNSLISINSDDAATNRPQLVITT